MLVESVLTSERSFLVITLEYVAERVEVLVESIRTLESSVAVVTSVFG